jgi:hypothetical protein
MMPKAVVALGIQSMAQVVLIGFSAAIDLIVGEKSKKLKKDADKAIDMDLLNMIDSTKNFTTHTLILDHALSTQQIRRNYNIQLDNALHKERKVASWAN